MCGFGVVHHGRINSAPLVLNPFDWPWAEKLFHSCGLERFFLLFSASEGTANFSGFNRLLVTSFDDLARESEAIESQNPCSKHMKSTR